MEGAGRLRRVRIRGGRGWGGEEVGGRGGGAEAVGGRGRQGAEVRERWQGGARGRWGKGGGGRESGAEAVGGGGRVFNHIGLRPDKPTQVLIGCILNSFATNVQFQSQRQKQSMFLINLQ